ncbi:MAG: hypothetical protein GX649_18900 [Chloroflexi bacterium]|nr:hypothetical protein [Chloroflexota bacterium]
MIRRIVTQGLALAIGLLIVGGAAMASSSANFCLGWSAPAGGDGATGGAQYRVLGNVTTTGAGVLRSAGYRMLPGYWPGASGGVAARPTALPASPDPGLTPGPGSTPGAGNAPTEPAPGSGLYLPLVRRGS